MTIHRFFISPESIQNNQIFLSEEISHQIAQVLRLKQGDQIILLDNSGTEFLSVITRIDKKHAEAKINKKQINQNEPELQVHLYQSIIARDNFELVLQKAVEIGVSTITPIHTERTQFGISWAQEKIDRWQKIIKEAAEQSERGKLPVLLSPLNFEAGIEAACTDGAVLIAWEKEAEAGFKSKPQNISIFIGPEGGFTEQEIVFATGKKAQTISLGKRILRSETAAIASLAKLLI